MAIPSRSTCRSYVAAAFGSLSGRTARVHFRLAEIIEHCALATATTEDKQVLSAAAYLQEVGTVQGSRNKAAHSLEMVQHDFREQLDTPDPRDIALLDCIGRHGTESRPAESPEGQLMEIIYAYSVTHYLDYIGLKSQVSNSSFEAHQLKRILVYSRLFKSHPRGDEIESVLQDIFLLREKLRDAEANSKWHRELARLHETFPLSFHGLMRAAAVL